MGSPDFVSCQIEQNKFRREVKSQTFAQTAANICMNVDAHDVEVPFETRCQRVNRGADRGAAQSILAEEFD